MANVFSFFSDRKSGGGGRGRQMCTGIEIKGNRGSYRERMDEREELEPFCSPVVLLIEISGSPRIPFFFSSSSLIESKVVRIHRLENRLGHLWPSVESSDNRNIGEEDRLIRDSFNFSIINLLSIGCVKRNWSKFEQK